MHGFTYQPESGRWYKPEAGGGLWYDPRRGEFYSERLRVWTVGKVWPSTSDPLTPPVPASAPSAGARLRAANAFPWTLDTGSDPLVPVQESIYALPRLDRARLAAWMIAELDEPDDKQGFEEFRDRVRRAGLRWGDRPGIYELFGERPPSGASSGITDAFARGIRGAFDLPANGPTRPRIKGRSRR